jgi:hypothetical protein
VILHPREPEGAQHDEGHEPDEEVSEHSPEGRLPITREGIRRPVPISVTPSSVVPSPSSVPSVCLKQSHTIPCQYGAALQAAPTFTNQLMNRLGEAARQVTGESVRHGRLGREKRCIETRPSDLIRLRRRLGGSRRRGTVRSTDKARGPWKLDSIGGRDTEERRGRKTAPMSFDIEAAGKRLTHSPESRSRVFWPWKHHASSTASPSPFPADLRINNIRV